MSQKLYTAGRERVSLGTKHKATGVADFNLRGGGHWSPPKVEGGA